MDAVMAAAEAAGVPEEARHLEYFSVPEVPDYENHPFTLRLAGSGARSRCPPTEARPMCWPRRASRWT